MFSLFTSAIFAMAMIADNSTSIRTMPVARTLEANSIDLSIVIPDPEEVVSSPVWIQFRIDGYSLGSNSLSDRVHEVAQSDMGQTVHVVIDDHPYFPINDPAIDPLDEEGLYYSMSYKIKVPFDLDEGMHVIRMFPATSFGESVKGDEAFCSRIFYVGSRGSEEEVDLSSPFLTYNEPSNWLYLEEGRPVLLDFFLSNTELSTDGYKVRLTVDGNVNRILTSWQPYYMYGLKKGDHEIRLELIDSSNQLVPGIFNNVHQTITIN